MIKSEDLLLSLRVIVEDEIMSHEKGHFFFWRFSPYAYRVLKAEVGKLELDRTDIYFVPFRGLFELLDIPGAIDYSLSEGEIRLSNCGTGRRMFLEKL